MGVRLAAAERLSLIAECILPVAESSNVAVYSLPINDLEQNVIPKAASFGAEYTRENEYAKLLSHSSDLQRAKSW